MVVALLGVAHDVPAQAPSPPRPSPAQFAAIVDAVLAFRPVRGDTLPAIDACALGHLVGGDVAALLGARSRAALVGAWAPTCHIGIPSPSPRDEVDIQVQNIVDDEQPLPEGSGPRYEVIVGTRNRGVEYVEVFRVQEFAYAAGKSRAWRVYRYGWFRSLSHNQLGK